MFYPRRCNLHPQPGKEQSNADQQQVFYPHLRKQSFGMNPEDSFHPVFFPSLQRGNQIQVQEIDHTCQEKQQTDTTNHIQIGTNAVTEHLILAE